MIKRILFWPFTATRQLAIDFERSTREPEVGNRPGLIVLALLIVFLAIPLGGCALAAPVSAGATAPTSVVSVASDKVIVEGGRALILANLAYQTVGTAAAVGIEQGIIIGETKVKVQRASQKAVDALEAGQRALLAGDKASAAVAAMGAVDELCGLHSVLMRACNSVR